MPTARAASRHAALDQVLELAVLIDGDMTRSLAREGLTTSRAHVLWELHRGEPLTQRALAEALGVSARNITGLVDGLAGTGFVTRGPHPTDRRATLVSLTSKGSAVAAGMADGYQELSLLLFGRMPSQQLDCLRSGLDVVLSRLRARLAEDSEVQDA